MAKKKYPDKLSQEVAQALAAGMSYGKWKAMQPVVPIEPKKPLEIYKEFTCEICGSKIIRVDGRNQKYCSANCRYIAYERQKRAKKLAGGAE